MGQPKANLEVEIKLLEGRIKDGKAKLKEIKKEGKKKLLIQLQSEMDENKKMLKKLRDRKYKIKYLEKENPEQRQERLTKMKNLTKEKICAETPEQRQERLTKMKNLTKEKICAETPEQRQ